MLGSLNAATVEVSQRGDVTILAIHGPLSASGGDLRLREELARALASGERKLVIDFAGLTTLDSSGLGELVRASGAAREADARLVWARCPKTMLDLLAITNVDFERVRFEESVDEAIEALG